MQINNSIAFAVIQGSKCIDILKMHGNYWLVENNNNKQLKIYRNTLLKWTKCNNSLGSNLPNLRV